MKKFEITAPVEIINMVDNLTNQIFDETNIKSNRSMIVRVIISHFSMLSNTELTAIILKNIELAKVKKKNYQSLSIKITLPQNMIDLIHHITQEYRHLLSLKIFSSGIIRIGILYLSQLPFSEFLDIFIKYYQYKE